MKAVAIRASSTSEMLQALREKRQQLLALRLKKESGQLEKTHLIREHRKDIAKLLLALSERSRNSEQNNGGSAK